jgi:hypothetical protein
MDSLVVVYCTVGYRSGLYCEKLIKQVNARGCKKERRARRGPYQFCYVLVALSYHDFCPARAMGVP